MTGCAIGFSYYTRSHAYAGHSTVWDASSASCTTRRLPATDTPRSLSESLCNKSRLMNSYKCVNERQTSTLLVFCRALTVHRVAEGHGGENVLNVTIGSSRSNVVQRTV
ncbi:hypothetical protein QTP88_004730 [Uroleucon formosanum]